MGKVPFFLPFGACRGRCVYCDQRTITGCATLPSVEHVRDVLLTLTGPSEVCFFGGSFCRFPLATVKGYLDAVAEYAPEGSRIRFSTYPGDLGDAKMLALVSSYNIGCVEFGVPSLDRSVLQACNRDADPAAICKSLAALRDRGIPIGVQMMIGLPGQTLQSSLDDLRLLAGVKGMQEWDLRLYPCLVIQGTELEKLMLQNVYRPLTVEEAAQWGGVFLERAVAYGFRPIRVGLQETESFAGAICGGPHHPALGELIFAEALALRLTKNNPAGPWFLPQQDRSKFTGHAHFGMRRLSLHTGLAFEKIKERLFFS